MITKNKTRAVSIDYSELLLADLKDPNYAAGYLTEAFDEGQDVFLLAVRDVAQALGGITQLSRKTDLNRENLYDIFSKDGNPRLSTIIPILDKLGFGVKFSPKLNGHEVKS